MPNRVQWRAEYSCGNIILDAQHQNMLIQCNRLADCIAHPSADGELAFDTAFKQLMAQAAEHFSTEEALLAQCNYPKPDEHHNERDEFAYLSNDIVTTENFERIELQRFLSLWWIGHIIGSGKKYRPYLAQPPVTPVAA